MTGTNMTFRYKKFQKLDLWAGIPGYFIISLLFLFWSINGKGQLSVIGFAFLSMITLYLSINSLVRFKYRNLAIHTDSEGLRVVYGKSNEKFYRWNEVVGFRVNLIFFYQEITDVNNNIIFIIDSDIEDDETLTNLIMDNVFNGVPNERKARTEQFLQSKGVPINSELPVAESETGVKIRKPEDVARRCLALFFIAVIGFGREQDIVECRKMIDDLRLWKYVTEGEKTNYFSGSPEQDTKNIMRWKIESVKVLLWALKKIEKLDFPAEECDSGEIADIIWKEKDLKMFITNAQFRTKSEILDEFDMIYRIRWATKQAELEEKEYPAGINGGVVFERDYTMYWLMCYHDWDDIENDA